jgi:L-fuculose-phosphate aldolase
MRAKESCVQANYSLKRELLRFCSLLYERGYLVSTDGNLSVRSAKNYLTTPTGRNKGLIEVEDLVLVDPAGQSLENNKRPSSELAMHLKVYELRPEVQAVVHCHPVYTTVIAASNQELDTCLITESIVGLGKVPKAPLSLPSTSEIPASIAPLIPCTDAILLANHGLLAYGKTLEEAYNKVEAVEHFAKIQVLTYQAGIQNPVPAKEVERLEKLRKAYGLDGPYIPCNREVREQKVGDEQLAEIIAAVLKRRMR